jgi:hypothetical protein
MTNKLKAQEFVKAASDLGWNISIRGSVVTITKNISGIDEFVKADSEYYWILEKLPSTSAGSIWGTDGGGVGAISAMKTGVFRMNKSGGSKLVIRFLSKLLK